MNELAQLHCSQVTAATPRLEDPDISQYQAKLPDWKIYDKEGEPHLGKAFKFKDFD